MEIKRLLMYVLVIIAILREPGERQPHERWSSQFERLRSRKPWKEDSNSCGRGPADADGSLAIYDDGSSVHLKIFPVHQKAFNDFALESYGKLARTVSHDNCFAMVSLIRGWRSFHHRLDRKVSLVRFDASGDSFFLWLLMKLSLFIQWRMLVLCYYA